MGSLLRLLEKRPLHGISVKDIVDDCGVSRNTFYYHFEDMPALVEATVLDAADGVMRQYTDVSSLEECYEAAMRLCLEHRKAIWHIYYSANREILERCLLEIAEHVAARFVDNAIAGRPVSAGDRQVLIRQYKCELFGFVIDWLSQGMPVDAMDAQFHRLCQLREGFTEQMLQRSLAENGN